MNTETVERSHVSGPSAVELRVMWQCEWCGAELTRVRGIAETSPGKKQAVGYCPKHGEIWSDEVAA